MLIIDIHTHIFESISGIHNHLPLISAGYGKVKNGNQIFQILPPSFKDSNSTIEVLLNYMDWFCVNKAILVPNVFYGYHNEYAYKAVEKYPNRFKALALVDITKGKPAADELRHLVTDDGFSGLKIDTNTALQFMPELILEDKLLEPIFMCCNDLELPVFFHLYREIDLDSIKKISDKFKKIKYIICHFGSESVFNEPKKINDKFNQLLDLVLEKSNIWIETSSVHYNYNKEEYPFTGSCKLIEKAYGIIGPEKIIWGSDYPAILAFATYGQLTNYIVKGCKKIPDKDKEMIMGKNALNIFWP